jgi:hypothetical protein
VVVAVEIEMCTSARWRNDIYNESDFLAREREKDQSLLYMSMW